MEIVEAENREDILRLVGHISPQAREFVSEAFREQAVSVFHYSRTEEVHGVFCAAENDDCTIAYVSFLKISMNELTFILGLIDATIRTFLEEGDGKELCFNVYGENEEVIAFIRSIGFQSDMEGYHLIYTKTEVPDVPTSQLIEKQFEPSMLQEFIELFDRGYLQLQLENGQITDWHSSNRVEFLNLLQNKTRSDELRSFWLDNQLIGSYLIHNNYIQDLVVNPDYQNCGYGSMILAHCVAHMRANKGIDNVCLRVAKSNWRAKRFYKRNHFEEQASFAEHTYIPG
ncbi:GNAT family N-acetyltransferase [Paenibacillus sp. UNC217MF]|uniref:GNAT family N-acetyltransferase n=1 Tax=Paenibacillus sp. UNC217MF TaxID=1449062 RepID=UPI00055A42D6|nr:GNAT family N-acetyltransferase [Paenibacillus sp. UNC217MF]